MDTTSAAQNTTGTLSAMETMTMANLIVIGILAILAIAIIVWGARLKRRRLSAQRNVVANREAAEQGTPDTIKPAPAPETVPAQPPVAPPPPPLADTPVVTTPTAPTAGAADLTTLKGLGPRLATRLAELGITRIDQIAALDPATADALDAQLGTFQGRMERDRWIEQARLLSAGDTAGYEAEFGKLGG